MKEPAQIPSVLPAGCKNHLPKYTRASSLGNRPTVEQVSEATKQWYDLAESEFVDIMRRDHSEAVAFRGRADGPSFT